jgi:DNA-binding SARP family transcriptional activator
VPSLEIGVLGPPILVTEDGARSLPGRGRQLLMCLLAAARGGWVSAEEFIDALWGDVPPRHPRHALDGQLYRLRRSLCTLGAEGVVVTDTRGYRFDVDRVALDLDRFERSSGQGRDQLSTGRLTEADRSFREALALCRGRPFGHLADHPALLPFATELEEVVLAVREDRCEAALALGHGADLVPELSRRIALHPSRERLWGLLMRSLAQAGRSTEALATYARATETLRRELGVTPGSELRAVHLALLEPSLESEDDDQPAVVTARGMARERPSQLGGAVHGEAAAGREFLGTFDGRKRGRGELLASDGSAIAERGSVDLLMGEPGIGETRRGRAAPVASADRALAASPADPVDEPASAPVSVGTFRREGEYWTIALGAEIIRLKDAKGLRHLAELLRQPGRGVHVLDLVAATDGVGTERMPFSEAVHAGLRPSRGALTDGPDGQARAAYRLRIEELEGEIADAETRGERDRISSLREEQQILADELTQALGFGMRRSSPEAERARVAVTNALRRVVRRMEGQAPGLAAHFDRSLSTGQFCTYTAAEPGGVLWRG